MNQEVIDKLKELLGIITQLVAYVDATEALIKTFQPLQLVAMSEDLQAARKNLGLEDK